MPVAISSDGVTVRIPLRDRYGDVVAHTIIDVADAAFVNQWTWRLSGDGFYAARGVRVNGQPDQIKLHRALCGLVRGDGLEVDHISRDKLDNRRLNLRVIPRGGNSQNVPSYTGATSPHRGVYWQKNCSKWAASVQINDKQHYLGLFTREEDAAEAAREARARLLPYAVD